MFRGFNNFWCKCLRWSKLSGEHYKGLSENQATVSGIERQICDNKDGGIPPVAGF